MGASSIGPVRFPKNTEKSHFCCFGTSWDRVGPEIDSMGPVQIMNNTEKSHVGCFRYQLESSWS